ncbi:MAG TPA: SAM-dependent methyltransferase [Terriglobia bacterium]
MLTESRPCHGVMEGGGAYNVHARIPAGGGNLALPLLEQALRDITLDGGDQPVVIADYGSSQGRNSLAPMRAAIKAVRARLGPDRAIFVVHVDQAANDFNTLFDVLHRDPDRYASDDPKVFPCAIGRSFYENVLPPDHVHLGWSSYAAVWLSRIPMLIPGHFMPVRSAGDVGAAFERQGAEDWKSFLSLRAGELRPGGRLVVVLPGLDDDGQSGFEGLFDHANRALAEMVDEGAIAADERARMVLGAYPRRRCHLLAPFSLDGGFRGLTVEHCDLSVLPDSAWADYEQDGNKEVLATRHARFFRAIFVPSLASALNSVGDAVASRAFADRLEDGLKRRLMNQPVPLHSFVQTMVLAKQGSGRVA